MKRKAERKTTASTVSPSTWSLDPTATTSQRPTAVVTFAKLLANTCPTLLGEGVIYLGSGFQRVPSAFTQSHELKQYSTCGNSTPWQQELVAESSCPYHKPEGRSKLESSRGKDTVEDLHPLGRSHLRDITMARDQVFK